MHAILHRLGPTPAARAAKTPTAREQAYLAALDILYGDGDKRTRDVAYERATQRLSERYPDDAEALAFGRCRAWYCSPVTGRGCSSG